MRQNPLDKLREKTSLFPTRSCLPILANQDLLDLELARNRVVTGDLIIAEFLRGFRDEREYIEAKRIMDSLEYRDFAGRDIALAASQNYRTLRKAGVTVRKTIDVPIATFCIKNDLELIHNDKDFDAMEEKPGLKVKKA